MTQTEYKQKRSECWEKFKRENLDGEVQWQLVSRYDVFCAAFDRAYALGKQEIKQETKQEKDADTVIQGWVGRDQDGNLPLFVGSKPYKQEGMDYWSVPHGRSLEYLNLNPALFPDLTWESDAEPVEIIIKRKKK